MSDPQYFPFITWGNMSDASIAKARITGRLMEDVFGSDLIDNHLRGLWAEYMVAEATGAEVVGGGWHAWDLQFGGDHDPDRIRIQVKNSARTQTWNKRSRVLSEIVWYPSARMRPEYIGPGKDIPCDEPYGFLCDVFVFCEHWRKWDQGPDHRDPGQWNFYIVSRGQLLKQYPNAESGSERKWYPVRPTLLSAGLGGGAPIPSLTFDTLTRKEIEAAVTRGI